MADQLNCSQQQKQQTLQKIHEQKMQDLKSKLQMYKDTEAEYQLYCSQQQKQQKTQQLKKELYEDMEVFDALSPDAREVYDELLPLVPPSVRALSFFLQASYPGQCITVFDDGSFAIGPTSQSEAGSSRQLDPDIDPILDALELE